MSVAASRLIHFGSHIPGAHAPGYESVAPSALRIVSDRLNRDAAVGIRRIIRSGHPTRAAKRWHARGLPRVRRLSPSREAMVCTWFTARQAPQPEPRNGGMHVICHASGASARAAKRWRARGLPRVRRLSPSRETVACTWFATRQAPHSPSRETMACTWFATRQAPQPEPRSGGIYLAWGVSPRNHGSQKNSAPKERQIAGCGASRRRRAGAKRELFLFCCRRSILFAAIDQ